MSRTRPCSRNQVSILITQALFFVIEIPVYWGFGVISVLVVSGFGRWISNRSCGVCSGISSSRGSRLVYSSRRYLRKSIRSHSPSPESASSQRRRFFPGIDLKTVLGFSQLVSGTCSCDLWRSRGRVGGGYMCVCGCGCVLVS